MPIDLKIDYILLKYEIQPTLSYDSIFFSAPTNLAHRIQLWNPFFYSFSEYMIPFKLNQQFRNSYRKMIKPLDARRIN